MDRHVVVVGSGYAGLSAAFELSRRLDTGEIITVVSASPTFTFLPSLIWVAQGWREIEELSFPVEPVLAEAGIRFIPAPVVQIDPERHLLTLGNGQHLEFDKLLLTTGGAWAWGSVPGLWPKPQGPIVSILSPQAALQARPLWQEFLANPGPAIIGLMPYASLYGAAYEFALNMALTLEEKKLRQRVELTFVTPEPYLGHFGHDGLGNSRALLENAFARLGIRPVTGVQIIRVEEEGVILVGEARLPSQFTMLIPAYQGIPPVQAVPGLADDNGQIPVDTYYRSLRYPDIFAAGVAMQLKPAQPNALPCGIFTPGVLSAEMGRIAAANLAADLGYGRLRPRATQGIDDFLYVLDLGSQGLFISLGPHSWLNLQLNLPGPWSRWAKVIAEKYQIRQIQTGQI